MERTWLEVNLDNIIENYFNYKKFLGNNHEIIAIVKANAYGHGDVEVAKALHSVGVKCFAVASAEEAIKIRKSGITGDILVLGFTPIDKIKELNDLGISQAVYCEEYADAILGTQVPIKVHIAVDTGMNRIGFNIGDISKLIETVKYYATKLNTVGIFTHLSAADVSHIDYTNQQLYRFKQVLSVFSNFNFEYVHYLNSAGGILLKDKENTFVRAGIVLYGLKPYMEVELPYKLKPALIWKARVCMVKEVEADNYIGYGLTYKTEKRTKIATVSVGYADGYAFSLSNKGRVKINGQTAKIIGRVCMDYFMVDVTHIDKVNLHDEVVLLDEDYTADNMAMDSGTIGYEVICSISNRVRRKHIKQN